MTSASATRPQADRTPGANDLTIYDKVANEWWDGKTKWLRTLHAMVPARMRYFHKYVPTWQDQHVLDLGCAGGFMAEAMAQRGAVVTGVDPARDAIQAARSHAAQSGLEIDYWVGVGENLDAPDASFDVIVCVDVLEHVDDLGAVLDTIHRLLKPGGWFCYDTINRNVLAKAAVIWGAENIIRLLPKGTHDPKMFITPGELRQDLKQRGFQRIEMAGLGPTGMTRRGDFTFGQVPGTLIQYMGVAQRG